MRTLTAIILASLVALCPILCGAVDVAIGSHCHGESSNHGAPADCPESSDGCICHGAVVQPSCAQVHGSDCVGMIPPLLALAHTPPHSFSHLTWNGSPSGLAALGDSLTVRAFLQNFRC